MFNIRLCTTLLATLTTVHMTQGSDAKIQAQTTDPQAASSKTSTSQQSNPPNAFQNNNNTTKSTTKDMEDTPYVSYETLEKRMIENNKRALKNELGIDPDAPPHDHKNTTLIFIALGTLYVTLICIVAQQEKQRKEANDAPHFAAQIRHRSPTPPSSSHTKYPDHNEATGQPKAPRQPT